MPTQTKINSAAKAAASEAKPAAPTQSVPLKESVPAAAARPPAKTPGSDEGPKAPIHRENGMAIWANEKAEGSNRPDYYVKLTRSFGNALFAGASEKDPVTFSAWAEQKLGPQLRGEELAQIVKGELFPAVFRLKTPTEDKSEYTAYLAPAKIEITPRKTGEGPENRTLRIGRAFPIFKTDDDEQRVQWGWEIERVIFPLNARHGKETLNFTPAHGFQLIEKKRVVIDHSHEVLYRGSEQKRQDMSPVAKLQITSFKREPAERPRVSEGQRQGQSVSV